VQNAEQIEQIGILEHGITYETDWSQNESVTTVAPSYIADFVFSPDTSKLAWISGNDIYITDFGTEKALLLPSAAYETVRLAFSPDNQVLASTNGDTVQLWDVNQGLKLKEAYTGIYGISPSSLNFSSDGNQLIGTAGNTAYLWDLSDESLSQINLRNLDFADDIILESTHDTIFTEYLNKTVKLWNIETGENTFSFDADVSQIMESSNKQIIFVVTDEGGGQLWGLENHAYRVLTQIPKMDVAISSATFNPDGTLLAMMTEDGMVHLWDTTTGQQISSFITGHTNYVMKIEFSPDGNLLATSSQDGTVRLWGVPSN
jgi:WD40 repeat protein